MLLIRKPWDSQPQEAVELSDVAIRADLFFERGGTESRIGNYGLTVTGTPQQSGTPYGIGRVFTASTQVMPNATWPALADGAEYSYLIVFHRTSASGGNEFLVNGDNASRIFQFRLETSGAVGYIAFNTAVSTFSATGTVVPVGPMHCAVAVVKQSGVQLYQNGLLSGTSSAISGAIKGSAGTAGSIEIGNRLGSYLRGSVGQLVRWPFALEPGTAAALSGDPFGQLFSPRSIWVPVSAGDGSVSGAAAVTNANDTSAASGTTTVVGTSAATNANDTSAASGSVGSAVTGTAAITSGNDTSAASGTTTVTGTAAVTSGNDTATASGWAGAVSGTAAVTEGGDTSAASGTATQPESLTPAGGGGWLPKMRRKTRKDIHAERIKLGILPPDVVKAATKAAAVVMDEPSPVKAYMADSEAVNKVFLRELGVSKMLPDYTRAIKIQIEIMQQEDEDLLLFF